MKYIPSFIILGIIYWNVYSPESLYAENSPNILLILVDDMGFGDLHAAGNEDISTPYLDELKKESVSFDYFYVSSVCAPTRASLLTGRYAQEVGVTSVTNGYETMDPEAYTLAEALQDQRYRTAIIGKWHLGEHFPSVPWAQGFDTFWGFLTGHTEEYFDPTLLSQAVPTETAGYITNVLTDKAIDFIEDTKEAPFFCYLTYNVPHTPLQIEDRWVAPYLAKGYDERTARVYGMISQLDEQIERLIKHLEKEQLLDNTIVIFMSDNGPINGWKVPQEEMRYNSGLKGQKFSILEGGIRTQSFWMWKDHWNPRVISTSFAAHIDVFPTLMDILQIESPRHSVVDGLSILPLLNGTGRLSDDRLFFQNFSLETVRDPQPFPGGITRKGKWKMVNGNELYDLQTDPAEAQNVAHVFPDTLALLSKAYQSWWKKVSYPHLLAPAPVPVGYNEAPEVWIQPHHGKAEGNIQFVGKRGLLGEREGTHPRGVDGDWAANWKEPGDQLSWEVDIVNAGTYELGCLAKGTGEALLKLKVGKEDVPISGLQLLNMDKWTFYSLAQFSFDNGKQEVQLHVRESLLDDSSLLLRYLIIKKLNQ